MEPAPLTKRDAAAPHVGGALTLATLRTDDPLAGVIVPKAVGKLPGANAPSDLQQVHAELVARLPVSGRKGGTHHTMPRLKTSADYDAYIRERTKAWKATKGTRLLGLKKRAPHAR
jgi:phospholipase C